MPKKEYRGLKREQIDVSCDFCGSDNFKKLFLNLVKCESCGLVYANPRPSKSALDKLYQNYYESKKGVITGPNAVSVSYDNIQDDINKDRIRLIERKIKPGKILDIGCGVGYFLDSCKKRGWNVFGVEPSKEAKKICKDKGIEIIDYSDFEKHKGKFDAITLFHVFEHIENPKEYLVKVSGLIRRGGVIMIEVPNIDSYNAKKQKKKWWYIQDMHLFYFSPKTIRKYLLNAGFSDVKVRPKGGFLINQMSGMEGGINKNFGYLKILKKIYYFVSETLNLSDCVQVTAIKK